MMWWLEAFLRIMPAYFANMAPAAFSRVNIIGLRKPIDGGRNFIDGKRILGDGKTWQGIVLAILSGTLMGSILYPFGISTPLIGAVLGASAIFGDLVGSFTKRRLGLKRGANAGLLDSMDFIIFSLLASLLFYQWELKQLLLLLVINPFLHRGANIIGYLMGLKDVPW